MLRGRRNENWLLAGRYSGYAKFGLWLAVFRRLFTRHPWTPLCR